ncbi:MAG: hypothetical protein WCO65_03805 [bacterium]
MTTSNFLFWLFGFIISTDKTSLTEQETEEVSNKLKLVFNPQLEDQYNNEYLPLELKGGYEQDTEPGIGFCFWLRHWLDATIRSEHRSDISKKSFMILKISLTSEKINPFK